MSRRPPAKPVSNHREIDPLISQYVHEKQRPREAEALEKLKKIASLVKPLMRARGWRVGTLTEFYPNEQNLLGLNKNRGQEILLRLRYPGDANQFLPMEQVVDTMLHELSHNVFGPHDEKFHALWDELRKEYEGLISKGYTGEGFLSEGRRLGGRGMPQEEAKRIRRIAAEKRAVLNKGSGQKLGGAAVPRGTDIRKVIVDAIERRNRITKGCASGGNKDAAEVEAISDQANRNGFRTQAEEDEANEAAIAQALWELHQEDEKQKYGNAYVRPTLAGPSSVQEESNTSVKKEAPTSRPDAAVKTAAPFPEPERSSTTPRSNLGHTSRLVQPLPAKRSASSELAKPPKPTEVKTSTPSNFWSCPVCTFAENPILHLCCDICSTEQPASVSHSIARNSTLQAPKMRSARPEAKTWMCHGCGNEMENQWWTCSSCGTLKLSSKD